MCCLQARRGRQSLSAGVRSVVSREVNTGNRSLSVLLATAVISPVPLIFFSSVSSFFLFFFYCSLRQCSPNQAVTHCNSPASSWFWGCWSVPPVSPRNYFVFRIVSELCHSVLTLSFSWPGPVPEGDNIRRVFPLMTTRWRARFFGSAAMLANLGCVPLGPPLSLCSGIYKCGPTVSPAVLILPSPQDSCTI